MSRIAIIPARGGSKRIPRKNVRLFGGQPMIAWSIAAARQTGIFSHIVVSTDDPEIAEVARAAGADVPFMRPAELADDFTPTIPVIAHAAHWLRQSGHPVDFVCCIYATAPFIQSADLQAGYDLCARTGADFVVPVTTFPFPIQRAVRVKPGEWGEMISPEHYASRSQDLEECFHDIGQFYWGTFTAWTERAAVWGDRTAVVRVPRSRVQDIDTPEDWDRAEAMFTVLRQGSTP